MGLALGLAAALLLVAQQPPPTVALDAVGNHEGERVHVHGWVQDVRETEEGVAFTLTTDGHALHVRTNQALDLASGDFVEAQGQLVRWNGQLHLQAEAVARTSPSS